MKLGLTIFYVLNYLTTYSSFRWSSTVSVIQYQYNLFCSSFVVIRVTLVRIVVLGMKLVSLATAKIGAHIYSRGDV